MSDATPFGLPESIANKEKHTLLNTKVEPETPSVYYVSSQEKNHLAQPLCIHAKGRKLFFATYLSGRTE